MNIPKTVHTIWIQSYNNLPIKYKNNYSNIKKINPKWEFIIWDDIMIKNILNKYPKLLYLYNNTEKLKGIINNYAIKSDIARFIIIKEYGGIYTDFDFNCIEPFDKLFLKYNSINQNTIYIASSEISFLQYIYPFYKPKYCGCFFAMIQNHPIWSEVINIVENAIYKNDVGCSLDKCLQENKNNYDIIVFNNVKSFYECHDTSKICFTPTESSWNPIRPFIKFVNCNYYNLLFVILFIIIIIFLLSKHFNM